MSTSLSYTLALVIALYCFQYTLLVAAAESSVIAEDDNVIVFLTRAEDVIGDEYERPVIGIVSHPGDGASGRLSNATNVSYIAASYVKFVESGGARVIPLIFNEPEDILEQKFKLINGLLFTGGWCKTGLYYQIVEKLFKDQNILERFNATKMPSTVQFVGNPTKESDMFKRFSPKLLNKLTTKRLIMQNHMFGLSPERIQGNTELARFFKILTTSTDESGKTYVSTVQGYNYPVTGFQWHPEKNAFEWGMATIPHSEDAVRVTQNVASFFISEARKSSRRRSEKEVLAELIYNYSPTYCGYAGKGYDEVYLFLEPSGLP
ncbi:gamma-glutamyl hydrolase 2 isoform X2 [Cryptomeria japonica]|uniref:gamma-glutamyl hydrolase 2 isoform X2 n=1 Tax=Cryptomeria japonica TaxID=3369 RepID=UPI0027DA5EFF|nr:gamma-glutamyl hydrolase 2 isoform X2 [Cryptomeria japonica]